MGVALHNHFIGQLHTTGFSNAANIVAAKVDQHQVLGNFLGVGEQFFLEGIVLLLIVATATGASNRPHCHLTILQAGQNFGGGTHDVEVIQIEEVHIG